MHQMSFFSRFFKSFSVFLVILCLFSLLTSSSFRTYNVAVDSAYRVTEVVGSKVQSAANTIFSAVVGSQIHGTLYLTFEGIEYSCEAIKKSSGFLNLGNIYVIVSAPENVAELKDSEWQQTWPFSLFSMTKTGSSLIHGRSYKRVQGHFAELKG